MSNEVQFDIDQIQHTSFKPKEPTLVRLVIKCSGGFIKDEKQANYALLGIAICAFSLSLFLGFTQPSPYNEKIVLPMPIAGAGDHNFRQ